MNILGLRCYSIICAGVFALFTFALGQMFLNILKKNVENVFISNADVYLETKRLEYQKTLQK